MFPPSNSRKFSVLCLICCWAVILTEHRIVSTDLAVVQRNVPIRTSMHPCCQSQTSHLLNNSLSRRLRGGGLPSEDASKKEGLSDAQKRIIDIETEMARTQKNKATMGHLCALKARLAALKRLVTEQSASKSGGPGEGFEVRATGDARVGFIGFPSVGKSTLLTKLTGCAPSASLI